MKEQIIRDSLIMLHPIRWKILMLLQEKNSEMYIDQIADMIQENRRLVSFHLGTLEEQGFLESAFKIIKEPKSKGKAGRYFRLTPKFERVRRELIKLIGE